MPRLSIGLEQVFTNLGIVGDGYKLFFFDTGTMTPKTTYSNEGLTVQNTNPVVLNEAGRPDVDIWGMDPSLYRMILGTPDSVLGNITVVVDVDPIDNYSVNNIAGLSPIPTAYWGTTEGTSTNYTLDPALVDITSYSNKQTFFIDFHIACAPSPDIDINDLGVLNFKKYTISGTKVALQAGDTQPQRHLCINDGVDIVVLNPTSPYLNLKNATVTTPTSQIFTSGTAATYTTPAGVKRIEVIMIGGGAGGSGRTSGGGNSVAGAAGGNTTFNSIVANGGSGPVASAGGPSPGGAGGTGGSGSATRRISGFAGQPGLYSGAGADTQFGANGACSPMGLGQGGWAVPLQVGTNGFGYGSGGAGGLGANTAIGAGGGSGEYVELKIASPAATYTYTVGLGGAGGVSTTNGGTGAPGIIQVYEYYL